MEASYDRTRRQDDATIALDVIRGRIARLDPAALTHILEVRSEDDLETLRVSVATLIAAVEHELQRRKEAGIY